MQVLIEFTILLTHKLKLKLVKYMTFTDVR